MFQNCYHGTTRTYANKIMQHGFHPSSGGWLGRGVYFFENDLSLAHDFAGRNCARTNVAVLSAVIVVDEDKVLDITAPHNDGTQQFHRHREDFIERVGAVSIEMRTSKQSLDAIVIDHLCKQRNYSLVRAYTYTYTNDDRAFGIKPSRIPNGIELCVKNLKTITQIKPVSLEYVI